MIKEGKAPKKIKYENVIHYYDEDYKDYMDDNKDWLYGGHIEKHYGITNSLNDIVEILDEPKEDKIEKLDYVHPDISCSYNESELLLRIEANKDKINEIIEVINEK